MATDTDTGPQTATFAAGCFWGVEEAFRQTDGVVDTRVGYTGGHTENPTYEQTCTGRTGHAEAVEVTFNPSEVSYDDLLKVFWQNHNPTTLNRQGPDVGSQYRSAIFTHGDAQKRAAEASKTERQADEGYYGGKQVVTEIAEAPTFFPAEDYHQQYLAKRGRASCRA